MKKFILALTIVLMLSGCYPKLNETAVVAGCSLAHHLDGKEYYIVKLNQDGTEQSTFVSSTPYEVGKKYILKLE